MTPRRTKVLIAAGGAMLLLRIAIALLLPELDSDAYGHFKLAKAFLRDPTNLRVHWVWLPGWHVLLAGPVALGASHTVVRCALAVLQSLGPWLLYRLAIPIVSTPVAYTAALFYTLAPLPNLLATSAQAETLFSLLLLGTSWALVRERGYAAGGLLGVAALLRYEAWGVVAWLGARSLFRPPRVRALFVAFLVSASAIGLWLGLRHLSGLPWFSFARGTRAFVERYHQVTPRSLWESALHWLALPWVALGPALALAIPGVRVFKERAGDVPAGVFGFLALTAVGGALLALPRYFTALTPFACLAMAAGSAAWCRRPGAPSERRVVTLVSASLALLTLSHVFFALSRVRA